MFPRTLFAEEHSIYREAVRRYIETEITPYHADWEKVGVVPREIWRSAGETGLLCPSIPEEFGGAGADFLFSVVVYEELGRAGVSGPGFHVHSEMVATYIQRFGTDAQKSEWLPKMVSGEAIGALGLTEPDAGSDLKAIRTSAVRDGDDYIINGQKVYISNGQLCDLIVLACKTDPAAGSRGVSFIIVEATREGFERGRNLEKIGLKAQDTSELFFNNVRVPVSNLIGEEGAGFKIAMHNLAHERLTIAVSAIAQAEAALEWTIAYVKERKAFGKAIAEFQNTRFVLASLAARIQQGRVFVDRCIELSLRGELESTDAAMAKMLTTELLWETADQCLQLFGGYGYMLEYPIARLFIDSRVRKIAGGSSEIMREIISRKLFED
jgi:long-chain-acyl-CoA dehydrogenase